MNKEAIIKKLFALDAWVERSIAKIGVQWFAVLLIIMVFGGLFLGLAIGLNGHIWTGILLANIPYTIGLYLALKRKEIEEKESK